MSSSGARTAGRRPATAVAVVTGASGQDGYLLTARLLGEGVTVHATVRSSASLASLRSSPGLMVHEVDLCEPGPLRELIAAARPDEVYNLAGLSSVAASFTDPTTAWRTNADAVEVMLEAIRLRAPTTRFYQSSSSEMFGSIPGGTVTHDERSALQPQSPYAASKAAAHAMCDAYRSGFDLRVACGIVFNHESRRRSSAFLTRKVVDHVRGLRGSRSLADAPPMLVGNLAAQRDWGYAPDYVDGILRIARQIETRAAVLGTDPEPDVGSSYRDYVLGTGRLHAVWQLVDRAFALADLPLEWDRSAADPRDWTARLIRTGTLAVRVDPSLIRPSDPLAIKADPSRARQELGWNPAPGIDGFLLEMLES
jgi:GDPmannose 4,6-dehydratase